MKKILILSVEAGYGHRKAAEAVAKELKERNIPGLQVDVMDALSKTNALFEKMYVAIYFQMVVWAPAVWGFFFWATDLPFVYPLIFPLRTLWNWVQSEPLRAYLKREQFDVILFTHFFPAEVCAHMKRKGLISSRLITVVTDIIPHHVWQNPGTDSYWVMAEESKKTLLSRGADGRNVFVGGIPINSLFLKSYDRGELESRFHLVSGRFTLLFSSGSFGTGPTTQVLDALNEFYNRIQVIVVCGMNQHLFQALSRKKYPFPLISFGLIQNMPEVMSVSDLLIAKPGGATMCESLAKNIPMVIMAAIPGQETYNAEWLLAHEVSFELTKPDVIRDIVKRFLDDPDFMKGVQSRINSIKKPYASKDLADFVLKD